MTDDDEGTCFCNDPFHPGFKLRLCDSDLCRAIMNKTYSKGYGDETGHIILTDDED